MAKQYKVGIYCRLSVDDASNSAKAKGYIPSDESVSIENQENICQGGISPKHLANCTFILDPHLIIGIDLKSHYTIQVSSV